MRDLMRDLNAIYRDEPALWEVDFSHEGFRLDRAERRDGEHRGVHARLGRQEARKVVCIANLAPVPRENYRVGLPAGGAGRSS